MIIHHKRKKKKKKKWKNEKTKRLLTYDGESDKQDGELVWHVFEEIDVDVESDLELNNINFDEEYIASINSFLEETSTDYEEMNVNYEDGEFFVNDLTDESPEIEDLDIEATLL